MDSTEWALVSKIEPKDHDVGQLSPVRRSELANRFSQLIGRYGFESEINIDEPALLMWCTHEDMIELAPSPNPLARLWEEDDQPNKCADIYLRLNAHEHAIAVTFEGLSLLRFARRMEHLHELPWLPPVEPLQFENFETAFEQILELTEEFLGQLAVPSQA